MRCTFLFLILISFANLALAQESSSLSEHYLFPEFKQGYVLNKSGITNEALLNYHLVTQEMIFDKNGQKLALGWSDIISINTVFIGDRKFVLLDMNFVELINNTSWTLYASHNCTIRELGQPAGIAGRSETSAIRTHSTISANGYLYELEQPNNYKLDPYTHYWLRRKSKLKKFVNMKTLKKLYKRKKGPFESYIKENDVMYKDMDSIIQLIQYMESI